MQVYLLLRYVKARFTPGLGELKAYAVRVGARGAFDFSI
jgi:hypothetical protein